eukprot:9332196-Pyramimonas_sp.AAC.1
MYGDTFHGGGLEKLPDREGGFAALSGSTSMSTFCKFRKIWSPIEPVRTQYPFSEYTHSKRALFASMQAWGINENETGRTDLL